MAIQVASNILPKGSAKWPVVEDIYIRGGLRVVANATARDAIYADSSARNTLKVGCLLITANDQRIWQYSAANTWTELKKSLTRTYQFSTPETIWNIQHNIGSSNFTYTIFNAEGYQVLPNACKLIDVNNFQLTFAEAMSGSVTVSFNL